MDLRQWIAELNGATTERDLVAVTSAFLKEVRRVSSIPDDCLPEPPASAIEIRKAAAAITGRQLASCVDNENRETYQRLLILFSLAVDRINMLQARGLLVPHDPRVASVPPLRQAIPPKPSPAH